MVGRAHVRRHAGTRQAAVAQLQAYRRAAQVVVAQRIHAGDVDGYRMLMVEHALGRGLERSGQVQYLSPILKRDDAAGCKHATIAGAIDLEQDRFGAIARMNEIGV